MLWARGVVEQAQSIVFTKARLVRRNLCSRSRESVGWGSGRECEEAVRRYSHLREFMFQGVKVNSMLTYSCHVGGTSRKIDFLIVKPSYHCQSCIPIVLFRIAGSSVKKQSEGGGVI